MSGTAPGTLLVSGCGLIGSSLLRAARAQGWRTLAVDPDADVRAQVEAIGIADAVAGEPTAFADQADLIALCAPPGALSEAAAAARGAAADGAVMFDTGSVKGPLAPVAERAAKAGVAFVPAHPIAGTERSGPEAGFASLFADRWCILTPVNDAASEEAVDRVEAFWTSLGARVARMAIDAHDRLLAATSHAPHAVAYALTATALSAGSREDVNDAVVRYSAGGFRDFTRIASSDPVMWRDVFLENADAVASALATFRGRLAQLERLVREADADGLEAYFAAAKSVRAAIVAQGQETPAPDFGRASVGGLDAQGEPQNARGAGPTGMPITNV